MRLDRAACGFFQKSETWRVGGDEGDLRPAENGINANFLRRNSGNRNVFRQMPEIQNVRLNRQALAEVLRILLHNTELPPWQPAASNPSKVRLPINKLSFKTKMPATGQVAVAKCL